MTINERAHDPFNFLLRNAEVSTSLTKFSTFAEVVDIPLSPSQITKHTPPCSTRTTVPLIYFNVESIIILGDYRP